MFDNVVFLIHFDPDNNVCNGLWLLNFSHGQSQGCLTTKPCTVQNFYFVLLLAINGNHASSTGRVHHGMHHNIAMKKVVSF